MRCVIVSREGRAKLVYRVPEEMRSFVDRKRAINWKKSDGTSFCVIEFRAGTEQLQDVLPPSIHPTTGKPYLWEGNFARMPDLPGELAAIWYDWESASGRMKDADPFRTKVAGVKPKRTIDFSNREGGDVIGKFNDAFSVWDVMSRPSLQAHYIEAGARWARKGSKDDGGRGGARVPGGKRTSSTILAPRGGSFDSLHVDGRVRDVLSCGARRRLSRSGESGGV